MPKIINIAQDAKERQHWVNALRLVSQFNCKKTEAFSNSKIYDHCQKILISRNKYNNLNV